MMTTAEREKMLAEMTRAEKAELLRWIVQDLGDDFPGIESKPDVMTLMSMGEYHEPRSCYLPSVGY